MPSMLGYELALTPGVASSIIAAGIITIQYTLPLFLGVILAGVIQNASTANTWSVVTTLLHGSRLHTINISDSVSTRSVARPVLLLYYLGLISLGLTALSGVLTPLGIHEVIAGHNVHSPVFEPVTGSDTFTLGTVGQAQYVCTRACGVNMVCPGQGNMTVMKMVVPSEMRSGGPGKIKRKRGNWPDTDLEADDSCCYPHPRSNHLPRLAPRAMALAEQKGYQVGSAVPASLTDLFGNSSYYGQGVAGVFDIQFRNYVSLPEEHDLPDGRNYTIGRFRFLESLITSPGYKLIDGLIVDTINARVGFRNHSAPRGEKWYGAAWDEVLLWMEPETVCVANNVSLEITTNNRGFPVSKVVDLGGFGGLAGLEEPAVVGNMTGKVVAGRRPDLTGRAWRGAYFFNKDMGRAVGGWNKGEGEMPFFLSGNGVWVERFQVMSKSLQDGRLAVHRLALERRIVDGVWTNLTGVDTHCAGFVSNTTSGAPLVMCGLIIGAPESIGIGPTTIEAGNRYPLYTCATAIRASLRNVTFMWNNTMSNNNLTNDATSTPENLVDSLASLKITAISPTVVSRPTWGIELCRDFKASQISPLWGPLDPNIRNGNEAKNLTVLEADYLYLPAGQGGETIIDSLAGTGAYQYAAGLMYESDTSMPDYSGRSNYVLYKRWETLTKNESLAALLPNLLWTDLFANMVTTKRSSGSHGVKTVHVYEPVLRYKMVYAVPGALLVGLWVTAWAVSLAFWVLDRVRVKEMRQLLNQVSTGRLVVNMLEESNEAAVPTKSWTSVKGDTVVGLKCRGMAAGAEGRKGEGYQVVGGMVVGFVEAPVEGRVLELLKGESMEKL